MHGKAQIHGRGARGRRRFAMARPVCGFDNAIDPGRDEGLA